MSAMNDLIPLNGIAVFDHRMWVAVAQPEFP